MTYEKIVEKVQKAYAKAEGWDVDGHKAIQINVKGEGEGAFYIEVSEGKFNVQPYDYYDNDALVDIDSKVLIDVVDGKVEPADAYAAQKYTVAGNVEVANKILSLRTVSAAKKAVKKAAEETKKVAKKATAETKKVAKKAEAETKKATKKATETAKKVAADTKKETKKVAKKATAETKKVAKKATEETKKVAGVAKETAKVTADTAAKGAKETADVAAKAVKETVAAAAATVKPAFKRPVAVKPADDKK